MNKKYITDFYYSIRYRLGNYKKIILELFEDSYYKQEFSKIKKLKNKYLGKRCFIIGNGPSINKMDLDLMKNDIVFCSNSFFLKFDKIKFIPNFITVEDHLVVEDNFKEFNKLKNIIKIYPIDLIENLEHGKDTYFIQLRRALNNKKNDGNFKFNNNNNEVFYWGGTVLYMNLQLASYMGFSSVYLLGVDLKYTIPDDVEITGTIIKSKSNDPNHFDPEYFGKGKRWHIPETDRMQKSFTNAYYEMKSRNIKLFNATKNGNLKNIPRINYDSLF